MFRLDSITNPKMRGIIGVNTNKMEVYNTFIAWLFFGDQGMLGPIRPKSSRKQPNI